MPADKTVQITINAKDGTKSTFQQIASSSTQMGTAIQSASSRSAAAFDELHKHAALVGTLLGSELAKSLQEFAAAGQKEEQAQRQLQQAVENTGHSYEQYAGALEKASSGAAKFGIDNVKATNALQSLTEMTGSAQTAMSLLQVTEDLAAAKHLDLVTAATLIGKVYDGNTAILKRYGIEVTAGATAQEALAQIQDKFAGQAKANTTTLSKFTAEFENFKGRVGEALGPLSSYITLLPGITSGFQLLSAGGATVIDMFRAQGAAAKDAAAAIETATTATKAAEAAGSIGIVPTGGLAAVASPSVGIANPAGLVIGAETAAGFEEAAVAAEKAQVAIEGVTAAMEGATAAEAVKTAGEGLAAGYEASAVAAETAKGAIEGVTAATEVATAATAAATVALEAETVAAAEAAVASEGAMAAESGVIGGLMGPVGLIVALGAAAAAFFFLKHNSDDAAKSAEEATAAYAALAGSVSDLAAAGSPNASAAKGALDIINQLTAESNAIADNVAAVKKLNDDMTNIGVANISDQTIAEDKARLAQTQALVLALRAAGNEIEGLSNQQQIDIDKALGGLFSHDNINATAATAAFQALVDQFRAGTLTAAGFDSAVQDLNTNWYKFAKSVADADPALTALNTQVQALLDLSTKVNHEAIWGNVDTSQAEAVVSSIFGSFDKGASAYQAVVTTILNEIKDGTLTAAEGYQRLIDVGERWTAHLTAEAAAAEAASVSIADMNAVLDQQAIAAGGTANALDKLSKAQQGKQDTPFDDRTLGGLIAEKAAAEAAAVALTHLADLGPKEIIDPNAVQGVKDAALGVDVLGREFGTAAAQAEDLTRAVNPMADALKAAAAQVQGSGAVPSWLDALQHGTGDARVAQVASDLSDVNAEVASMTQVVIGNTDAIGKNSQSLDDWATKLIAPVGTYAEIDDLLNKGAISYSTYTKAQDAGTRIFADNARVQQDIQVIQAKEAPLLADLADKQAKYLDEVAKMPAQQQLATLALMDSGEQTKAQSVIALAAAAAQGKYGDAATAASTQVVQAAVDADPALSAMLQQLGLISVDHNGKVTLQMSGFETVQTAIDKMTDALDLLIQLLGGVPPDTKINVDTGLAQTNLQKAIDKWKEYNAYAGVGDGTSGGQGSGTTPAKNLPVSYIPGPNDPADANVIDPKSEKLVSIRFNVDDADAKQKLAETLLAANKIPPETHTKASVENADAMARSLELHDSIGKIPISHVTALDADASSGKAAVSGFDGDIKGLPSAHDTAVSATVTGLGDVSDLGGAIDLLRNKDVYVTTYLQTIDLGGGATVTGVGPHMLGGVIQRHASGGVASWLAEAGPEWLDFPNGGHGMAYSKGVYNVPEGTYVHTAPATKAMGAGGARHITQNFAPIYIVPTSGDFYETLNQSAIDSHLRG